MPEQWGIWLGGDSEPTTNRYGDVVGGGGWLKRASDYTVIAYDSPGAARAHIRDQVNARVRNMETMEFPYEGKE